jgi:predicted MFS family arabinose efflux permease
MSTRPAEDWRIVASLFGVLFLGVADNQVLSPLLPAIRTEFGKSSHEVGMLFTGYSLMAGVSVLFWGPLSDSFGPRKGLLSGLLVFSLGSTLSFASTTYWILFVARVITGMGASLLSLNTIACAAAFFPYASRGWAMGTIFSSYFAALILGVPIGSLVADSLGWHAVFAMAGATALLALAVLPRVLPKAAGARRKKEAVPAAAGPVRTYLGFLRASKSVGALISSFLASAGTTGFIAFVGVWLHDSFGVSGKQISLVFLASGAAALVVSPIAGSLSDRIGKRIQFVVSNLVVAVFLLLAPRLTWGLSLFLAFGIISLGAAFRQGPMEALITEVVPADTRGAFIALKNSFSQLGIAVAALASGLLYEWEGYWAVCFLCAGFTLAAAAVMLLMVRDQSL